MSLPEDLKHLYLTWLEEDAQQCQRRQQKSAMLLLNAVRTLRAHTEPIHAPEDLAKLKGIGNWIVSKMRQRLDSYCEEEGFEKLPVAEVAAKAGGRKRKDKEDEDGSNGAKRVKEYIPRKRSGGYAILLVLLELDEDMMGVTKDLISANAAPYCDTSFTSNPSTSQFYSAWNSSKKLISEGLLKCSGRPQRFYLTEEGLALAKKIKKNDQVLFRGEQPRQPRTGTTTTPAKEAGAAMPESPQLPVHIPRNRVQEEYRGTKYFIWEAGSYDVKFTIDNREIRSKTERDFFDMKLQQLGVECLKRPLAVGDGVWVARHKTSNEEVVLNYILERKRLDDLASSIIDGRYTEQKTRLKRTGIDNILYLIEEVTSSDLQQMSQAIQTSIALATMVNGFHVQRTKDADATLHFIHRLTKQVVKFYTGKPLLVLNPSNVASQLDYARLLTSFKRRFTNHECVHLYHTFDSLLSKSNMTTVREMFVRMLMTVRGITLEKAIAIQRQYKTPRAMFERFDPDEAFVARYGKKVSEQLAEVFGRDG